VYLRGRQQAQGPSGFLITLEWTLGVGKLLFHLGRARRSSVPIPAQFRFGLSPQPSRVSLEPQNNGIGIGKGRGDEEKTATTMGDDEERRETGKF